MWRKKSSEIYRANFMVQRANLQKQEVLFRTGRARDFWKKRGDAGRGGRDCAEVVSGTGQRGLDFPSRGVRAEGALG